ncbi:thiamine pyrophosphate-binding protein [Leifsonia sp. P73]|uniref:thiamine pyrophosphate-binding protein n=1 Tax=Leifsonia sp. P73 TaxID=3423959 RepID=UPI003DA3A2EC
MSDATVPLARYLFERLVQLGVDSVFGLPGDFSLALLDELETFDELAWVGAASELGAAYAADGYARARGLGVLATTFGVGELGASGAVAGSMAEDVGVLHIVSSPTTAAMSAGALVHHTLADGDHSRFLRVAAEITHSQHVVGPRSAALDIDRALSQWTASRLPTYLLVPQDLSLAPVSRASLERPIAVIGQKSDKRESARALIADYFDRFPSAIAVMGHLIARWARTDLAAILIERGTRMATLPNSKGVVDESVNGYLGVYNGKLSNSAIRDAVEGQDGRVLIGCTLADTTTGGLSHAFAPGSTLVVSRDGLRWGGQTLEGVRFVELLDLLSDQWPKRQECLITIPATPPLASIRPHVRDAALTQDQLWASIASSLPRHTRLFADTGTSHYGALDIAFPDDTAFEPAPIWSAIGYSLPAALGAAIGDRSRRVVAVIGDGATQLVAQEFGLIHRERLNPVVILVNNDGYTVERVIRGPRAGYNSIATWDWPRVPRALGVPESSLTIDTVRDSRSLAEVLTKAFDDPTRAYFIEVMTDALDAPPTLARMAEMLRAKAMKAEVKA